MTLQVQLHCGVPNSIRSPTEALRRRFIYSSRSSRSSENNDTTNHISIDTPPPFFIDTKEANMASIATDLPYAAEAETSLSYDELEVSLGGNDSTAPRHGWCMSSAMGSVEDARCDLAAPVRYFSLPQSGCRRAPCPARHRRLAVHIVVDWHSRERIAQYFYSCTIVSAS